MKARIVGDKAELGPLPEEGLTFYGHNLSREWSEIDPNPDVLKKLRGNRHVELSGDKTTRLAAPAAPEPEAETPAAQSDEEAAIRAELLEFGVEAKPDASLKVLKMQLGKARKAAQAQD